MNNVYTLRRKLDMTQDEFAEFCDVSRISIARYDAGARVSSANAEKIAAACGVSVSYVLGINDQPDQDDTWALRERLRRDPALRMLFSAADKASSEHILAAAAMLKALEGDNDD